MNIKDMDFVLEGGVLGKKIKFNGKKGIIVGQPDFFSFLIKWENGVFSIILNGECELIE